MSSMTGETFEYTQEVTKSGMGSRGIKCLLCGLTSYHPNDYDAKFCGNCHHFHANTPPLIPGDQVAVFAPGEGHYRAIRNTTKIGTITRVCSDGLTYVVNVPGLEELSINAEQTRVIEWRMRFYSRPRAVRSTTPATPPAVEHEREIPESQSWPQAAPRQLTPAIAEPEPAKPIGRRWWRLWW